MRFVMIVLAIAVLALQGRLWLSGDGFHKTRELRAAVAKLEQQNRDLERRNANLEAEVDDLKHGRAAAEERARSDLGLIGASETFFQVVPTNDARLVARSDD